MVLAVTVLHFYAAATVGRPGDPGKNKTIVLSLASRGGALPPPLATPYLGKLAILLCVYLSIRF